MDEQRPSTLKSLRFTLHEELGSGGFGVVYRATDKERGEEVALKLLHRLDAGALYRFKQEFRSLADISHPNLVTLHELISEQGQWFFTMDLVRGEDLLQHVGLGPVDGGPTEVDAQRTASLDGVTTQREAPPVAVGAPSVGAPPTLDEGRLRAALPQLAAGVKALHDAGKLHRDIKPANVLVERGGRVVLLDFGLITELSGEEADSKLSGTPYYMAPEQAVSSRLTEAADWYSVGVILYQLLTGELPHKGTFMKVLLGKQQQDPPPPLQINPAAPVDLARLCEDLLERDPRRRPDGASILERLGLPLPRGPSIKSTPSLGTRAPLVGRDAEWQTLSEAHERAKRGQLVIVHVFGPSGVGKSTLVQRFIDELMLKEWIVALSGRCYEQESVPYKALDSLVDALCNHLRDLPPEDAAPVLPRNLGALAQLFPVLNRVEAVTATIRRGPRLQVAPQEQRRRAFAALRDLLGRLGERTPLLVYLDDVQWGDEDSAQLLERLLSPPDPPPLLLLACYRAEALDASPFVRRLRQLTIDPDQMCSVELPLGALGEEAAQELARSLFARSGVDVLARAVAVESKGNPFLLNTLVDYVRSADAADQASLTDASLEKALQARLEALPDAAVLALELVCLAGLPLSARALSHACGVEALDRGALRLLRTSNLIRSGATERQDTFEPYHDRVRETVVGFFDLPRRQAYHGRLAAALESVGEGDPEVIAAHLEGAGEPVRAAAYVRQAADQASRALAFDRAAALYGRALELDDEQHVDARRELRVKLADALSNARRGPEAAEIYLLAAADAEPLAGVELKRCAAEELMKTGYIDRGRALLNEVLESSGMTMPGTPRRALLLLLWRRLQLRLRGTGFTRRQQEQIPPELLARIDLCWTGWIGLGMHDFIHAAELHAQNLRLSLQAGDPYRISRALVMEATFLATGGASHERFQAVLERASQLAELADSQHARALVQLGHGLGAYMLGRLHEVHGPCVRAEQLLRGLPHCSWEMSMAHLYAIEGLIHTGRLGHLQEVLRGYIEEADTRGDLFGGLSMRVQGHVAHLAADEPELALTMVRQGMDAYTHEGVRLPHYWEFYAIGQIHLYRGEGRAALEWATSWMPRLKRAQLLRVHVARLGARYLLGRAALMAAAEPGAPRATHLSVARKQAGSLAGERTRLAQAMASSLRAGAAVLGEGDVDEAGRLLERSETTFKALQMNLYAAIARRRQGQLRGGDQGRELVARVDAWLGEQRVRCPERLAEMLIPGFAR